MFSKLKQFKDLRDKAKTLQTALADVEVEGTSSMGKITVTMDGNQTIKSVHIDDSLIDLAHKSKLEEGIADACNDAIKKGHKKMAEAMKGMKGFDLPGMTG